MQNLSYIFILSLCLVSCIETKRKDKFTDTYSSGTIPVAIDANFQPILQEEIDVFSVRMPNATINPIFTDEISAVDLFLKDSVRVAIITRPLSTKEITYLKQKTFSPKSFLLAKDGIALIINRSNKDSLINVSSIKKILTGKATKWSDIYPNSKLGRIKVVFDNNNSSTVRYAIDSICLGEKLAKDFNAQNSNASVINYVSKTPNAIGVIGVNWLNNSKDSTNLSFDSSVRVMSVSNQDEPTIDGSYKPYQAYLFYGNYPLTRNIYVLLNDPRGSMPTSFSTFLTSEIGQRVILKAGLVPATQPVRIVSVKSE